MRITSGLLGALLLAGSGQPAPAQGPAVTPLLDERFDQPTLGPEWVIDVSPGNTVTPGKDGIEIRAAENTYAHLQRPLERDHVRAWCLLKPGSGISWCTSLFLYWRPADWCQIGVIPRGGGRYYACLTTAARRDEYDLARCRFDTWHHLAIELGTDCIRFLTSPDGASWQTRLLLNRPPRLMGPPALLVVGKGFGLGKNQPDLDGDYGTRGAVAVSRIRRVRVEPTPPQRMRITPAEARAELADRDPLGSEILARPGDPDFQTVAARLPALARPREVVGVKDHPYEVGVDGDGTIQLADDSGTWEQTGPTACFQLGTPPVRFGATGCRKTLLDGYLPVVIAEFAHDGLRYQQTVLGYSDRLSPDSQLWAYVRLRASNPGAAPRAVEVALRIEPPTAGRPPLRRRLNVPARGSAQACFRIPSPPADRAAGPVAAAEFDRRLAQVRQSWATLLNSGMRIRVPEQRVNNAYRAWLAYNYLNVDKRGGRYEPHDGAGFYEQIFGYSAALYCHALDLWARHADARRYLESLLSLQRPDGLFFVRYGMPDHGALLLALSEHYRLTGEAAWLRRLAPKLLRMCDWVIRQRSRSRRQPAGDRPLTRGLIRFVPYADYPAATFNYYADAYCCTGIEHAAAALRQIGLSDEARRISAAAAAYRADILASMDRAVVQRDGMKLLPIEPDTRRLLESGKYRGGGYYGLIASMLLEAELLRPAGPRARWITDCLERRGGLLAGMCEFDGGVDHAYTYGYWLNCLRRDRVRRLLLGFYGTLACGMGRDTYCGVEVTQLMTGEPTPTTPHTYSGTQQLRLLRMMLLHEQDDELVIGQAIPRAWLEPGKRIEVRDAASAFGPLSFTIESQGDPARIVVQLDPPARHPPASIRLRLRHPAGLPIRQATVNGRPSQRFTADSLLLAPRAGPLRIELTY